MAFEKPITIQKAIQEIQSNKFVLPAIQREFVWDTEQIENLFDSLMKGYPIGSFLFWEVQPDRIGDFQFYRFMDRYHERDITHNFHKGKQTEILVKGLNEGKITLEEVNAIRNWDGLQPIMKKCWAK